MKWIFGLLLLVCLAFFALMQWGGIFLGDSKSPQLQPPLNEEKIKLLPADILAISAVQPEVLSAVKASPTCVEWGDISGSDLSRATSVLSALNLGNSLTQRQIEHVNGYWVYIPPLKNSIEVEKKVTQIKELGLEEYFVVQDAGKWRNAISLGVFKTIEAARKFKETIKTKGLDTAKWGERMSKQMYTAFVLKDPDSAVMAKMSELKKDFPNSELNTAPCTKPN